MVKGKRRKVKLRRLLREYGPLIALSEAFGVADSLEGEVMEDIISEHPDFAPYLWEDEIETADGRRINPRLHIIVETAVQCQLAQGKPPEARRVYQALLNDGVDHHVARHALGYVLMNTIWLVLKGELTADPAKHYCEGLKRLGRQRLKHEFFTGNWW